MAFSECGVTWGTAGNNKVIPSVGNLCFKHLNEDSNWIHVKTRGKNRREGRILKGGV